MDELLVKEIETAVELAFVLLQLEEVEMRGLVLELVKGDSVDLGLEFLDEDQLLLQLNSLHLVPFLGQEVNHRLFLRVSIQHFLFGFGPC